MRNIINNYTYAMLVALIGLQRFANAGTLVNTTTGVVDANTGVAEATGAMSVGMKTYYTTEMLENARNEHYFAQFGKKQVLPRNHGMTIEWRKWNTLPLADVLKEAVIPTSKRLGETAITGSIRELGMYVTISRRIQLHHVDDVILGATEELGASAGDTQDVAIRNALAEGTNVLYADKVDGGNATEVTGRYQLDKSCVLTPDIVNQVYTIMRKNNVPTIDGKYICVLHPSAIYDLRSSDDWTEVHKYASPEQIFNGEVGELHNVRFISTHTAPVWAGAPLNGDTSRFLSMTTTYSSSDTGGSPTYGASSNYKLVISETPTKEMVGRYCHVYDASANGYVGTVQIVGVDVSGKALWLDTDLGITPASGDKLFPGEGGAEPVDGSGSVAVYGCMFFGKDAYGIIDPEGAGLEMIIKTAEQAGGPLNQFSTAGYKLSEGTKILYQERLLRVECCSARYSAKDGSNMEPFKEAE